MHGTLQLFNLTIALFAANAQDVAEAGATDPPSVGYASAVLEDALSESVGRGLRRGETAIVDLEASCLEAPSIECFRSAARERALRHFVFPVQQEDSTDARLLLSLVDAANGEVLLRLEKACEICGRAELEAMAEDFAGEFARRIPRYLQQSIVLVLSGEPLGATVYIDEEEVGALPWTGTVPVGLHSVRVTHPGHLSMNRKIKLGVGVEEVIEVALVPKPQVGPDGSSSVDGRARLPLPRPTLGAAIGLLAGGSAVLAAGITLILLDGQPVCEEGEAPDASGRCMNMLTSARWGTALTAVGAAAAGAGAALLTLRFLKVRRVSASLSPRSVMVTGRF